MGKHMASNGKSPGRARQTAGGGKPVDPNDRGMIEPDRGAVDDVSEDERSARDSVHTDRDPVDDMHLAASDPGGRRAVDPDRRGADQTDPSQ